MLAAIILLFLTSNINGTPISSFTLLPESHIVSRLDADSLATSCIPCQCPTNSSQGRSIIGIVWSCLSTIFACTWVAMHPNIPAQKDSFWTVMRRRFRLMLFMIFAPEMVTCWAVRQWLGARITADQFRAHKWTKTHGFFIQMGGFMLHDGNRQLGVLSADKLRELVDSDTVDFPTITEEEIKDRSKGDYLAKGIVILQTWWFLVQCFARLAQHLVVTEMEVVTMAFAVLNGIVYFFWWNKPVDIQCPVPVFLKTSHNPEKGLSETNTNLIQEPVPISDITADTSGGIPLPATGYIHSDHGYLNPHDPQPSSLPEINSNQELDTATSVPLEDIHGVHATAPMVAGQPSLHHTPVILSKQGPTHILPTDPSEDSSRQVSHVYSLHDDLRSRDTQKPLLPANDSNPEFDTATSAYLEDLHGVRAAAPMMASLRDDICTHAGPAILSTHTLPTGSFEELPFQDRQVSAGHTEPDTLPHEDIRGVHASTPVVRHPGLRDDVRNHLTPAALSEPTHTLPGDPSEFLSKHDMVPTALGRSAHENLKPHVAESLVPENKSNPEPDHEAIRGIQATTSIMARLPSLCDDVRIHPTPAALSEPTHILLKDPPEGSSRHDSLVPMGYVPSVHEGLKAHNARRSLEPENNPSPESATAISIPLEDIHDVQTVPPVVARHPILHDDVRIHPTSAILSEHEPTHIIPEDSSQGLSRQDSQFSTESAHQRHKDTWSWKIITSAYLTPFAEMVGVSISGSTSIPDHSTRVPTFYARRLDGALLVKPHSKEILSISGGLIASLFGAIHCIAWHFHFPTNIEQIIWRASALLAGVAAPNAFTLLPMIVEMENPKLRFDGNLYRNSVRPLLLILFLGTFLYFPARLCLLVEACISLRSVNPSALENVQWTSFIPHI